MLNVVIITSHSHTRAHILLYHTFSRATKANNNLAPRNHCDCFSQIDRWKISNLFSVFISSVSDMELCSKVWHFKSNQWRNFKHIMLRRGCDCRCVCWVENVPPPFRLESVFAHTKSQYKSTNGLVHKQNAATSALTFGSPVYQTRKYQVIECATRNWNSVIFGINSTFFVCVALVGSVSTNNTNEKRMRFQWGIVKLNYSLRHNHPIYPPKCVRLSFIFSISFARYNKVNKIAVIQYFNKVY